jgi:hypothetical protein
MSDPIERILERREMEYRSPGSIKRWELVRDINFLVREVHELDAEILVLKGLLSVQGGVE